MHRHPGELVPAGHRPHWLNAYQVSGFVQWTAGVALSPIDAAVLLALYSIAAYGPRWASRLGLAVGVLGAVLAGQRYVLLGDGSGAVVPGLTASISVLA